MIFGAIKHSRAAPREIGNVASCRLQREQATELQPIAGGSQGAGSDPRNYHSKPFLRYVTGSITNSSEYRFSYLVVKIELLDENRKVVGNLTDAVLDFGPGQIWNFEAGIVGDEAVAAAQIKEIKGWL